VTSTETDTPTLEPVDPDGTLFDAPRLRPPGSFYAVRRTDGGDIGEYAWITVDNADHWSPVEREAEWLDGPTEFEMVLMVPTRIGVRTFGPAAASTPRCSTVEGRS
jgi:hypothetical protein